MLQNQTPKGKSKYLHKKVPQCAVPNCKVKKTPFHSFPKDDKQLFDIWKCCISNKQLDVFSDKYIQQSYRVCDDHFVESCKLPVRKTLKKYSIPTLNVTGFKKNSNLNIAYKLYIEKQETSPVKNITYVDSLLDESENPNLAVLDAQDPLAKNEENINKHKLLEKIIDKEVELKNNSENNNTEFIIEVNSDSDSDLNIQDHIKKYSGPNRMIKKSMKPNLGRSHGKCSAPNCTNTQGSFHKFPKDPKLCQSWTKELAITFPIKNHMKICSNHFEASDFFVKFVHGPAKINNNKLTISRMNLKKRAIPHSFNNSVELKQICAANNCFNNNKDHRKIHFYPFPNDETLAKTWAINASREDLIHRLKYYKKSLYLCSNHFEKNDIIPTIFTNIDCMSEQQQLYSNLFMQTNNEIHTRKVLPETKNTSTLKVYLNDPDKRKITYEFDEVVDRSRLSSDYGQINSTYSLYEDFIINPGVLDLKPHKSDLLFKKDYCRLCAKLCSVASLISIFDKNRKFTIYGEMIELCLPGKVNVNDTLPHWICPKCEYKLDVCCSSIKGFIQAEQQLKNIFNKHQEDKGDISNINNVEDGHEILTDFHLSNNNNSTTLSDDELSINNNNDNASNIPPEISKIIEENKKYQCLNCDKMYNTKKELINHSLASHNTNTNEPQKNIVCEIIPGNTSTSTISNRIQSSVVANRIKCSKLRYECVICSSLHEKKDSLIKHSLRYHSTSSKIICRVVQISNLTNKNLTCLHCKEDFRNLEKYRQHMKQHMKLNCDKCGKHFTRRHRLIAHARLHDLKPLSCGACAILFNDEMGLVRHQVLAHKTVNPDDNKCSECNEQFNNSKELLKHKKVHNKSLCNICGKLFASSTLLKYHLDKHNDVRAHKCSICSKSFQTIISLKQHKLIHSTEKKCICQVCGKQFGYLSALLSHMLSHSTNRQFVCELCGAAFHRSYKLKNHLKTHEKIDCKYKCKICGMEFNSKLQNIRHKKEQHANKNNDNNKKPFRCDVCSKEFLTKFQVKIHCRIHTGETPFSCEECGKSFRSVALRKQHKLTHMNVFKHQCNYCDRKFRYLQSLAVHRRTHTGEKPYSCPICAKPFANRNDMNKHKRNLHASTTDTSKNLQQQSNGESDNIHQQLDIDNILLLNQDEFNLQDEQNSGDNILTSLLND